MYFVTVCIESAAALVLVEPKSPLLVLAWTTDMKAHDEKLSNFLQIFEQGES